MAGEWTEYRLGDITKWLSGGTPAKNEPTFWDGNIPWISASSMNGTRFSNSDLLITEVGLKNGSRLVPKDTILLLVRGSTLHQRIPVGITLRSVAFNQDVKAIRVKNDRVDPWFLLYWFLAHEKKLLTMVDYTGIGAGRFDTTQLQDLLIIVPPEKERNAITNVLRTIDDKIELNQRMNETLEAMARAIFKSWFVDFAPVRAKACGEPSESICRRLGLTPDLLALFPDRLQDSELGEIPKGWEVKPLPSAIDVNPTRPLRKGVVAPYLDMANMPTTSARALGVVAREFGSGMKFENGDTLVARITPCLENGKTCFVDFLSEGTVGWGSTEYIVLRPKPPLPPEHAYFLARTDMFRSHAIANMTGTSGRQRVPASAFDNFNIVLPHNAVANAFGQFASSIITKMRANDLESQTLETLRDTLLPKLLSGELRLPGARLMEDTA